MGARVNIPATMCWRWKVRCPAPSRNSRCWMLWARRAHRHDPGPAGALQNALPSGAAGTAHHGRGGTAGAGRPPKTVEAQIYRAKKMLAQQILQRENDGKEGFYMELFDKNGCLSDEGLHALTAGRLDELGRLETAEHLSYCDKCIDRYTALLTADALETPRDLRVQGCDGRHLGAADAEHYGAVLQWPVWRRCWPLPCGVPDHRPAADPAGAAHMHTGDQPEPDRRACTAGQAENGEDRQPAQPEILESQWTTTSRSSRLRWQKHSMTCCSEPAALQQKTYKNSPLADQTK